MIDQFKLIPANVDGCAVGLLNRNGTKLIKKPWCFVCSDVSLANKLKQFTCNKEHEHAPCAGKETYATGFYPEKLADVIVQHVAEPVQEHACVSAFCESCYERMPACVCHLETKVATNCTPSNVINSTKEEAVLQQ